MRAPRLHRKSLIRSHLAFGTNSAIHTPHSFISIGGAECEGVPKCASGENPCAMPSWRGQAAALRVVAAVVVSGLRNQLLGVRRRDAK